MTRSLAPHAVLYRMHIGSAPCPFGLKARDLLRRKGYRVEDHLLTSREEVDALKAQMGVKTTPQIIIEGEVVGGYDDLRRKLGLLSDDPGATSYRAVTVLFIMAALMALGLNVWAFGTLHLVPVAEQFVALSMCLLALQKLADVEGFSTMFLRYDLLGQRWVPYASLYPYAEGLAGLLMLAGVGMVISVPLALFIGGIGAVSVAKAVYWDKRELKCACTGSNTSVPLGFVSLTENLVMVAMAVWMLVKPAVLG